MKRGRNGGKSADTQLNIRVDFWAAQAFRDFCTRNLVTQNEALRLLLQNVGQDYYERTDPLQRRLRQQEEIIKKIQADNDELRRERAEKYRRLLNQRRDWFRIVNKMLMRIVDRYCVSLYDDTEPLKRLSFKRAKEYYDFKSYQYPESVDCFVLTMHFVCYGKGVAPPMFICGVDETGNLVKLRWYPKEEYLGLTPRAERYVYGGAPWLVGCLQATDGAMDIIAGIPFADSINQDDRTDNKEPVCMHDMLGKSSLDVLIARLEGIKDEHAENRLDSSRLNTIANKQ